MRFLIDPWASILHAYIVAFLVVLSLRRISPCRCASLIFSCGPLSVFKDDCNEMFCILHGIAESTCNSNFFPAYYMVSLKPKSSESK